MATDTSNTVGAVAETLDSVGVATLLVAAGVLLFVVPEPLTSILGLLLVLAGAGSWLAGRVRG